MEQIGEIFRSTRLAKGLTIIDVENSTKIRRKYLQAIEEDNFEVIPGKVYLKGFIKSYAKFLEIEDREEIQDFLNQKAHSPSEQQTVPTQQFTMEKPKKINKKIITIFLGILAILALWGVHNFYQSDLPEDKITEKPSEEENIIIDTPQEKVKEDPVEPKVDIPTEVILELQIIDVSSQRDACWVQLFSDGNLIDEGTLYENDVRKIVGQEKVKVKLGNAGAVKLTLGENDLGVAGKIGDIVEMEFTLEDMIK